MPISTKALASLFSYLDTGAGRARLRDNRQSTPGCEVRCDYSSRFVPLFKLKNEAWTKTISPRAGAS